MLLCLWFLWIACANGFSWASHEKKAQRPAKYAPQTGPSAAELLNASRFPKVYAEALYELEQLESEPLCHRVAARLLMNHCQLVDGKSEADVLTDSGREVRDFIDAYSASLAICDLERGSFPIPSECQLFRESTLSHLPLSSDPQLHVTSDQIKSCLQGLGQSHSTWNTWVGYRLKALTFCEAARADTEKAQNIQLFQRLTKIMAKVADGVEVELEERVAELNMRAKQASELLHKLEPHVQRISTEMAAAQRFLDVEVGGSLQASADLINHNLQSAGDLQEVLKMMLAMAIGEHSKLTTMHEDSFSRFSSKVNAVTADVDLFVSALASAVVSSTSIQDQLDSSNLRAMELAARQDDLDLAMQRLLNATEAVSAKYDSHMHFLTLAQNTTNDILDTLEVVVASAMTVNTSLFSVTGASSWLPYIICPLVMLVLGSYGLPPSLFRNFTLLALGGLIGVFLVHYDRLHFEFLFTQSLYLMNWAGNGYGNGNDTFTAI